MKSYWTNNNLLNSTSQLQDSSLKWTKETLGDIFYTKKHLLARINEIQCSPAYPYSSFLQNLETSLVKDYNDTLKLEEDF